MSLGSLSSRLLTVPSVRLCLANRSFTAITSSIFSKTAVPTSTTTNSLIPKHHGLLKIESQSIQPAAGTKHVPNPRRRCKHCYIIYDDDVKWVFCDKYPRHKQAQRIPKQYAKSQMIMTHATQGGKRRKGDPRGRMTMWTQQGLRMDF